MMRNLKLLGLALAAIFALAAVAASAASANQFHTGSLNTTLTVSSNATAEFQYETGGQTIECTTVGGSGEISGKQTATEVTYNPTYSGCKDKNIFGSSATVDMNGCDFLFTIEASESRGPVHVKCPAEKQITITVKALGVTVCTFHFAEQTPGGFVFYANNGAAQVDVTPSVSEIVSTRQGSSECGEESSTTGQYVGKAQVTAEVTGQQSMTSVQVG